MHARALTSTMLVLHPSFLHWVGGLHAQSVLPDEIDTFFTSVLAMISTGLSPMPANLLSRLPKDRLPVPTHLVSGTSYRLHLLYPPTCTSCLYPPTCTLAPIPAYLYPHSYTCLLYTSDAADDTPCVDL
eukprot:2634891-Pleurochrysis_carterae.AAC.1